MRHGKKFNKLGRKKGHRKALLRNLSIALITHKRIETTLAKAKALRRHLEPIITKAKKNTMHSRRIVFSYLQDKEASKELFGPIAAKIGDRPGGYLRIIRTGFRQGDGADLAMIEFVDFNEVYLQAKEASTKRKRTRRGGKKKSSGPVVTAQAPGESAADEVQVAPDAQEEEIAPQEAARGDAPAVDVPDEPVEAPAAEESSGDLSEEAPATEEASVTPDDLKKVEGIGPKIEEVLNSHGVTTFAQLAATEPETIKAWLTEAGSQFATHDPGTWPKQAELAAAGKWDELKAWQDELQGGK